MLIYEVNIAVDNKIIQEYKIWLDEHVAEMLKLDGFYSAKIISNNDAHDITNLTVQYEMESQEKLNNYFDNKAKTMRQAGQDKYGDYINISRKVFDILE